MTALAATLRDEGRIDEAVAALRAASRSAPHSGVAQSELLFTLGFSDKVSAEGLFAEHFNAGRRKGEVVEAAEVTVVSDPRPPHRTATAIVHVDRCFKGERPASEVVPVLFDNILPPGA